MFVHRSQPRSANRRTAVPVKIASLLLCFMALTLWLAASDKAAAQSNVWTLGAYGYIDSPFLAGDNWFDDSLFVDSGNPVNPALNTLNILFPIGSDVPEGTTVRKWISAADAYTVPSVFHTVSGWTLDYTVAPGDGAVLNAPSAFVNHFVGQVAPDFINFVENQHHDISEWFPPAINTPGVYLLSCEIPLGGASFAQVVGRGPRNGESVRRWDPSTQTDSTTTYQGGAWNNGVPSLGINEAASFTLAVPEPGTVLLLGVAAAGFLGYFWRRRS
jgi:hypothetical protein